MIMTYYAVNLQKIETKKKTKTIRVKYRKRTTLCNILTNSTGLETFAQYLLEDGDIEFLLCFIELLQYKYIVDKRYNITHSGINTTLNQKRTQSVDKFHYKKRCW